MNPEDISMETLAKAAYANSLVMETMLTQIMIATASLSSPENPALAIRAMRARADAIWSSSALGAEAGDELLALMKTKSDGFWSAVMLGAETISAGRSVKN